MNGAASQGVGTAPRDWTCWAWGRKRRVFSAAHSAGMMMPRRGRGGSLGGRSGMRKVVGPRGKECGRDLRRAVSHGELGPRASWWWPSCIGFSRAPCVVDEVTQNVVD